MGGSSGGSSGKVSYPDYMETIHSDWLTELDALIATGIASNPYESVVAYDPDTDLTNNAAALAVFDTIVTGYTVATNWTSYFSSISAVTPVTRSITAQSFTGVIDVTAQVAAHKAVLDDDLETDVLPQFRRSMQNVGAAMTSAFPIGEALLIAKRDRALDKFQQGLEVKQLDFEVTAAEIDLKNNAQILQQSELDQKRIQIIQETTKSLLNNDFSLIDSYKALTHYTSEINRIKIVAKGEEAVTNLEYDVKEAQWDFSLYTEGANMLAAISGAATQTSKGPSKAQSVIGGAMSGVSAVAAGAAAMGTVASGGTLALGAGIGAALGLF